MKPLQKVVETNYSNNANGNYIKRHLLQISSRVSEKHIQLKLKQHKVARMSISKLKQQIFK